jgi:hypothetical protein
MNINMNYQSPDDGIHRINKLRIEETDSYIKHMKEAIAELSGHIQRLPKVDKEGRSECPFAESLYAKKEEETKKFIEYRSRLNGYIELVNREIERFRQNLNRLSIDFHKLNLPQAQDEYQTAKYGYEFHYQKNIKRKEALVEVSKQADDVLLEASKKKWPLGNPREKYSFSTLPSSGLGGKYVDLDTNPSAHQVMATGGMQPEIDNLMAIGPIGKEMKPRNL